MLFNWDLLRTDPLSLIRGLILTAIGITVAITVHEFSHGFLAKVLGDATAERNGRLSFNPLAHLDPLGTIMLFLVGFGWGKPVPVNPFYLKYGPRTGMALVGLAGPLSNLLFVALFGVMLRLVPFFPALLLHNSLLMSLIREILSWNIVLAVFNLIPVPPLDGSNILRGVLPHSLAVSYSRIERYGPAILIIIILIDNFTRVGILRAIMRPAINFFANLFLG